MWAEGDSCSCHPPRDLFAASCGTGQSDPWLHFFQTPAFFWQKENATVPIPGRSYLKRSSVGTAEDQAAVEKVLAGDTSAFEGIVRRWQGPLGNLA